MIRHTLLWAWTLRTAPCHLVLLVCVLRWSWRAAWQATWERHVTMWRWAWTLAREEGR